ncbi:MAG: hypothetical protein ACI909_003221 [Planctomycetota bacterium]|jgi:hypothetical protein
MLSQAISIRDWSDKMTPTTDTRGTLSAAIMFFSGIALCNSPLIDAAGLIKHSATQNQNSTNRHHINQAHSSKNTQYNNQQHGGSSRRDTSPTKGATVTINQISPRNSSHNNQKRFYNNNHHSYPGKYSYIFPSYGRNYFYSSTPQYYYNKGYTKPDFDSRFPNSYQSQSYYPQIQSQRYRDLQKSSVNAWELLLQGQTRIALKQFSNDAMIYPKSGLPKIGYALAAAASGDLKQGVAAMRRAYKIDPESLHYYQVDHRLLPLVDNLIGQYQYSLSQRGRRKDEAFMVAALSYLIHDYPTAHQAMERAKRDGDRSPGLRNLGNFLEEAQASIGHSNEGIPSRY